MDLSRAARAVLVAAIAMLLAGAALVISGRTEPVDPIPVAAPAPLSVPVVVAPAVAPPSSTAAPRRTTTTVKSTPEKATPTTSTKQGCGPDGWRPNAECPGQGPRGEGPCLDDGTIECEGVELGPYVDDGSGPDTISPGESALEACVEQTGMSREECVADAAAGNAS